MSLIAQIAVFLGATVLAIPLFRRLRLSSILGYLAAASCSAPGDCAPSRTPKA
jgi:Kef-type K+ transport system membrane component KefB